MMNTRHGLALVVLTTTIVSIVHVVVASDKTTDDLYDDTSPCKWGSAGDCGENQKCPDGSTCEKASKSASDGFCCWDKPRNKTGDSSGAKETTKKTLSKIKSAKTEGQERTETSTSKSPKASKSEISTSKRLKEYKSVNMKLPTKVDYPYPRYKGVQATKKPATKLAPPASGGIKRPVADKKQSTFSNIRGEKQLHVNQEFTSIKKLFSKQDLTHSKKSSIDNTSPVYSDFTIPGKPYVDIRSPKKPDTTVDNGYSPDKGSPPKTDSTQYKDNRRDQLNATYGQTFPPGFCPYGYDGECSYLFGPTCRDGTTCKLIGQFSGAPGRCCIDKAGEEKCPSGIVESKCLRPQDCQHGYTCRYGFCCRDSICPKDWENGGQCNLLPGQQKCKEGYDCINDVCCRPKFCPSGLIGPTCSKQNPCKPGYSCKSNYCCRDPVCPKNWTEGGSCNFTPGQPKCREGYQCIDGFCCRVPEVFCPSGVIGRTCSKYVPCDPGYTCRFGFCCRDSVCPMNWENGGQCNLLPGQQKCKEGYDCINDVCCRPTFCPLNLIGPACSKQSPCKPGYSCKSNYCCRDPVCPKNWTEGGSCNFTPGQPRCREGYQCIDGFCCRVPEASCPSGDIGNTCSNDRQCDHGYTCRNGICCRDSICPKDWENGGQCNLLPGQQKCKKGYDCINDVCCRPKFCPSGLIGPTCSKQNPCKPGYSCKSNYCCRDPVCPKDWAEGGSCNLTPGQPKCREGYQCIDGFCCRVPEVFCPSGVIGRICSKYIPCDPGYTCRFGFCCRDSVCPMNWENGGQCNLLPGQQKCKEGYDCINDVCCRPTFCPLNLIGPACSKQNPCKPGYSCKSNYCCRDPVCPKNWTEGGVCNLTPGQPRCREGYQCIDGFCCRVPETSCPSGDIGNSCSNDFQCDVGYSCRSGVCCRDSVCPNDWEAGGKCNFVNPLQPKCKEGYDCFTNVCCRPKFCPSGLIGPTCSKQNPCKPGYSCKSNYCCRDPVCPKNWTEGGSCNLTPGQPKCKEGYQCIDGFCCRVPEVFCPSGVIGRTCSKHVPCDPGYTCRFGFCCRDSVCPKNWIKGESCNFLPGQPKCKEGYECINGTCCRSTFCPSGSIGSTCSAKMPCEPGYKCINNYCCKQPFCPDGWLEGGVCNLTPGQEPCKPGFECNNDFCCKRPDSVCPDGTFGEGYCNAEQGKQRCGAGYQCVKGICCRTAPQVPVCKQPKKVGPCKGAFPRWFYNTETKSCEQFIYGGCQGNENNFERREDCENKCGAQTVPSLPVCKQPKLTGPCRGAFPRWFFNYETKTCEQFTYGGCHGNDNNFERIEDCLVACAEPQVPQLPVCLQPKDVGPCHASIPRWFFNLKSKSCEQFMYGGCKGNENNFKRKEDCEKKCSIIITPPVPVCKQPKKVGPCKGALPRWFYNTETKSCEQFIYGGCQGNENNFERREDCEKKCGAQPEAPLPVCKQPQKVGPCKALIPRWFYNSKTNKCERFFYGGCQGNDNNFQRKEDCERLCIAVTDPQLPVCKQPKKIGPCDGVYPRWFYNYKTKVCEPFIFGGCEPNDNNFITRDDCERRCGTKNGGKPKDKEHCPFGQDGTCGGIVGHQCRPGTKCMFKGSFPDAQGKCCIVKHENKTCQYGQDGVCGGVLSLVCKPGTTCKFRENYSDAMGKCCVEKPSTEPRLPVCKQPMKVGPCDGIFPRWFYNYKTKVCEPFIFGGCEPNDNNFIRREDCERQCGVENGGKPKDKEHCPFGQDGTCGGIVGHQCRPGTKCMFKGSFPDAQGKCCIVKHENKTCQYGQDGVCGGVLSLVCKPGTTCKFRENYSDAMGKCCVDKPSTEPRPPVCKQPMKVGPCDGIFPRWFYNYKTKVCEPFIFGGCEPNDNNFIRREDCERQCGVENGGKPKDKEHCPFGQDGTCGGIVGHQCRPGTKCMFKGSFPDAQGKCCIVKHENKTCQYGQDGVCGGVLNLVCKPGTTCKFRENYSDAMGKCCVEKPSTEPRLPVCKQPMKVGPCDGIFPRWFYNYKTNVCEPFIFGGCEPNDNNFIRREDCERQCGVENGGKPKDKEHCPFGQDGTCGGIVGHQCRPGTKCMFKGSFPDAQGKCCIVKHENKTCQYGQDGVCGGVLSLVCKPGTTCKFRENYSDAMGKCCVDKPSTEPRLPVCKQPMKVGPCDGIFLRWFYNYKTKVCEPFIFGGCEPNDNNFIRREDCERQCGVQNGGKPKDKEHCPFGQDGTCGGIVGHQCRPGTKCMFKGSFPDAQGKCCIVKHENKTCQYGQDGVCGGVLNLVCKPGTTCKFIENYSDAMGKCCVEKPSTEPRLPVCKQPMKVGPCDGIFPRWFYNYKTKVCEPFIFGGCEPNDNNFIRREDCERQCGVENGGKPKDKEHCPFGQDGTCGGIVGHQCRPGTKCMFKGSFPDAQGKCCIVKHENKTCQYGQDGVCGGVLSLVCKPGTTCKFRENYSDAMGKCCVDKPSTEPRLPVCKQPMKVGPCDGIFPRWFYNYKTKVCEPFIFGGCEPNDNNFIRREDCERQCGVENGGKPKDKEHCPFGQDGTCGGIVGHQCRPGTKCMFKGSFPDAQGKCCIVKHENKTCQYGQDGVCGGVLNLVCKPGTTCKFRENYSDAMGKCCVDKPSTEAPLPICKQPKKVGPCDALIPRWFFNSKTNKCERFFYGGCQGNDNNFQRKEDCERLCIASTEPRLPVCKQPMKVGPCDGIFPRWFYNYKTKVCEPFIFGGCEPNDNNFIRREDCERQCGVENGGKPKDKEKCRFGQDGICGGIAGFQCRPGTMCMFKGSFPDAAGKCCIVKPENKTCQYGQDGVCGGVLSLVCKPGTTCRFKESNPTAFGKCCIEKTSTDAPLPVCKQPKKIGPCDGSFPRWFYNYKTKVCEPFNFGGCEPNDNNFMTREDCEGRCGVENGGNPKDKEKCQFGQDGICGGIAGFQCRPGTMCMFKGSYPDAAGKCCIVKHESKTCQYGQDGVCGGVLSLVCKPGTTCKFKESNPTAFGKCCIEKTSTDPQLPVCKQPKKIGPCDGVYPRWFYNYKTKACEPFIFGGCEPNDNNFIRKEDCERQCGVGNGGNPKDKEKCRFGQDGICGGIAGFQCRTGTRCMFKGSFPDAAGKCCIVKSDKKVCQFGQNGTCGGMLDRRCPPGTECRFKANFPHAIGKCCVKATPGNFPDAVGKYCITKQTTGRCPPPESHCSYTPSSSCTRDECEKKGLLCCQDKCGSACKKPVYY